MGDGAGYVERVFPHEPLPSHDGLVPDLLADPVVVHAAGARIPLLTSQIQDSGNRREFESGALRDIQEDKGRYDLIPPEATRAYAKHMQNGIAKYGERNWEKGIPLHSYIDSAKRHLDDLMEGKKDENHAWAALWNIGCYIATAARIDKGLLPEDLDDLPFGR